jgi:hypothetical protein
VAGQHRDTEPDHACRGVRARRTLVARWWVPTKVTDQTRGRSTYRFMDSQAPPTPQDLREPVCQDQ